MAPTAARPRGPRACDRRSPATGSTERSDGVPQDRASVLLIATNVNRRPQPAPFDDAATADSHANLAGLCAALGLDLWLAHCASLRSEGAAVAWRWHGHRWQRMRCPLGEIDLAYADLPLGIPEARAFERALSAHSIPVVNDPRMSDCLTDKVATHDLFPNHVPTTWSAADPDLAQIVRQAELPADLDASRLFLKPRFGERGRGIFVTDLPGLSNHSVMGQADYIVQPFLETGSGIPELGIRGRHDLRLIVCNGRIELCFARQPGEGSYLSNCSQGGRELPLEPDRLPVRVTELARRIDERLSGFGPRLYSLDIGIGRSGKLWIFELNTMPGIAWDEHKPENRPLHEKMHRIVARWLHGVVGARVHEPSIGRDSGSSTISAFAVEGVNRRRRSTWPGRRGRADR